MTEYRVNEIDEVIIATCERQLSCKRQFSLLHMHGVVADLVLEQHSGLLGPGQAYLGQILSALAEVYRQADTCNS